MIDKKIKVLISAYACSPLRGSEHGTGWNIAWELAREFDVHLLTRGKNRADIDKFLGQNQDSTRLLHPHYLELPGLLVRAKSKRWLPLSAYYALWQLAALNWGRQQLPKLKPDICHHLTFNSFEFPSFWHVFSIPTVLGPIGGGQVVSKNLLPLMRKDQLAEKSRSLRVFLSAHNPLVHAGLKAADAVLFANSETQSHLGKWTTGTTYEMVDVGVDCGRFRPSAESIRGKILTLLYVGKFEARKGIWLIPEILGFLLNRKIACRISFVGDGSELGRFRKLCEGRFPGEICTFKGKLSHVDTIDAFRKADFVIFPSVRDTSGAVVLEALACGCPVACFAHQGAAWMVNNGSGILIDPSRYSSLREIACAFAKLIADAWVDEARYFAMRSEARKRAERYFSWTAKAALMSKIYRRCLKAF